MNRFLSLADIAVGVGTVGGAGAGLFRKAATVVMSAAARVIPRCAPVNLPTTFEPLPARLGDPLLS